jgi:hypothetical protein
MSRNSKNARQHREARDRKRAKNTPKGAEHLTSTDGRSAKTGTTKKTNAWWQKGTYSQFINGNKKGKGRKETDQASTDAA